MVFILLMSIPFQVPSSDFFTLGAFKQSKLIKFNSNQVELSRSTLTSTKANNNRKQYLGTTIQTVDITDNMIPFDTELLAQVERQLAQSLKTKRSKLNRNISITKIDKDAPYTLRTYKMIENGVDINRVKKKASTKTSTNKKVSKLDNVSYWQTVYSIESKQGKLLYRPRNKSRNCNQTLGPCGHHQLTVQALKDIGCISLQCRKDRLDYNKSLQLSKKLLALNEKRLRKNGLSNLKDYEKYLIHQQGANGIKNIIAATKGKKNLSKKIKKNMANNSPYSYRQIKRMGSKKAAKKFMQHWQRKWMDEKRLILASAAKSKNYLMNHNGMPRFDDNDLNYTLNIRF